MSLSPQLLTYFKGYIQLGTLAFTLFCLPETIFSRRTVAGRRERSFADLLLFKNSGLQDRKLRPADFLKPFYMFKYLAIVIPGFYYMTAFGFGSVLFAATGSSLFHKIYQFDVAQTGLMLSIPLLIGCLLGEMSAGWLTDHMVYRYAKKHGGRREPEPRINAIPLAVLCPIGIIIDGVCLSHHKTASWVGAAFGMGIANFGLQVATTITYSYCTDVSGKVSFLDTSTKSPTVLQTPEFRDLQHSQPFPKHFLHDNLILRVGVHPLSLTEYTNITRLDSIPLGEKIEYQYAWLIFALINVFFLVPMVLLRFYGVRWRNSVWQKPPTFHDDI